MAGPKYHVDGFQTLIASLTAVDSAITVVVNASTAHRMWLTEINMGNVGTPADLVSVYYIGQVTADGNGTSSVGTMVEDAAERAIQAVILTNHTTEPTYVNSNVAGSGLRIPADGDLLRIPLNHRATWGGVADHASATTDYMIGFDWIE
jgi:hypothetical protein